MPKRKAPPSTFWRGETLWGRAKVLGRDIKWSLRTSDPKLAARRLKEGRERLIAVRYGDARRTFDEVIAAWAPHIARQVAARTADRYACSLAQLEPFLRGKFLDEVNGTLMAEIIRKRSTLDNASNATIKRDLVALSSVMNHAIDLGWLEANPVLPRMKRLKERRDPIVLPELEHIEMIIERAPGMFAKMVETALKTGARQEELAGAQRVQLDHERRQLTIKGKGNKIRVIDLEPFDGFEVLRSLPAAVGKAWMFWHGQGQRYSNVSSRFRALCVEVSEAAPNFRPFRFHDLRHRHAVDWLKSGRSIYDLQQRLGHASIKTTELYLVFLTPDEKRTVMLAPSQAAEQKGEQQSREPTK